MHLQIFEICAVIIVLSALFGYLNARFLKLPNTIGLMIVSICFTGFLFVSTIFTDFFFDTAHQFINQIDFQEVLLEVMLGFLLFAGAMHTNFDQLRVQRWPVLVFSTLGVLASTLICGVLTYFGFRLLSIEPKFIHCLLFGALISPTDPIAVLGILKQAGVPKKLETKIMQVVQVVRDGGGSPTKILRTPLRGTHRNLMTTPLRALGHGAGFDEIS